MNHIVKREIYPFSYGQKGIFYAQQENQNNTSYNLDYALKLNSEINVASIKKILQALVNKHESLRTSLIFHDDDIMQVVLEHQEVFFEKVAVDNCSIQKIHNIIEVYRKKTFDLKNDKLFRVFLFSRSSQEHFLLFSMSHLISDAGSLWLLAEEFLQMYSNKEKFMSLSIKKEHQYNEFVSWQKKILSGRRGEKLKKYWVDKLSDLPFSSTQNTYNTKNTKYVQALYTCNIPDNLNRKIRNTSVSVMGTGFTPFTIFLGTLQILISKQTGKNDVLLGLYISQRSRSIFKKVIGYFVNTIILTNKVKSTMSLNNFMNNLNANLLIDLQHRFYPFECLVNDLRDRGIIHDNYFVDVFFNYIEHEVLTKNSSYNKEIYPYELKKNGIEKNILIEILDDKNHFSINVIYNSCKFDYGYIQQMVNNYIYIIECVVDNVEQNIAQIDLFSNEERYKILSTWNKTESFDLKDRTLHQLFEEQVEKTPDNIALIFENQQLTYRELNDKANQLARAIRNQYQEQHNKIIEPDTLIALYLDRSLETVISILATLKAGGAYVPIAPEYPQERTLFILEDTGASLILTQEHHLKKLDNWICLLPQSKTIRLIPVDSSLVTKGLSKKNLDSISKLKDLAYVIYTSGTTGKPKGVMVEQNTFAHFIQNQKVRYQKTLSSTSTLSLTNYTFDIFGLEYSLALITGDQVILSTVDKMRKDLFSHHDNIGIIQQTPSMWQIFLSDRTKLPDLSHIQVLIGGESGQSVIYKQLTGLFGAVQQVYGPTETCIWSTYANYSEGKEKVIGQPFAAEKVYVLSEDQEIVPIGTPGELYVGGAGLARGYLNQPELTAKCFIDNPFVTEEDIANGYTRLYRTGDIVRWLPDGNLEYLGRNDNQVKIRGFRIELQEIESALTTLPYIKQAIVVDQEKEGYKYIAAYIISEENFTVDVNCIREELSAVLPEYMMPATFNFIKEIPLTTNGKLNRHALPKAEFTHENNYEAPRNPLEKALCSVWKEVLDLEQVGIQDNFFYIGGDSVSAIKLVNRMNFATGNSFSINDIFTHKTISSLVQHLNNETSQSLVNSLTLSSSATRKMYMIHPASSGCEAYQELAEFLQDSFNCIGINNYNMCNKTKIRSLKKLASIYLDNIISLEPGNVPIYLLGWSFGGNLALEIAAQLEQRGRQNIRVYLLDTLLPTAEMKKSRGDFICSPEYESQLRNLLLQTGYDNEHINKMFVAMQLAHEMVDATLSSHLKHTKIVLFKAGKEDDRFKLGQEMSNINKGILQIKDNNIHNITSGKVSIHLIKEKHHDNLIEAAKQISNIIKNT